MEAKKYELTDETITLENGKILHRIRALRSFSTSQGGIIRKGILGGFVENEDNLSHKDNCWIRRNAMVYDQAVINEGALIDDYAKVYGNAIVRGWANVSGQAQVFGDVAVCGHVGLYQNVKVYGHIGLGGYFSACNDVILCGDGYFIGKDMMLKIGKISNLNQILTVGPIGSRDDETIFILQTEPRRIIYVQCGCFIGTINEFENAVMFTHKNNLIFRETYWEASRFAKKYFNITFPITKEVP